MKKIIAVLMALTLVLSLAACGSKAPAESTAEPTKETAEATTEAAKEETTEAVTETTKEETTETVSETETEAETSEETEASSEAENGEAAEGTIAQILLSVFKANAGTMNAEEMAQMLVTNENIQFMGGAMPVEEGFLNGFTEEITGFKEAAVFSPMIGSIPFIGYIFTLESAADADAFMQNLKDKADLRWNICTAADEMLVDAVDDTVFFIMAPESMEE